MDGGPGIDVVGIVPAAGRARRVSPLPCSKELFPVGFYLLGEGPDGDLRPKPVCCYLLEQFRTAGIRRAFVILGEGKWDIPAHLGDGSQLGMMLGYLIAEDSPDTATTVNRAAPFVSDTVVAFGFPDIVADPRDAFVRMLDRQMETGADVVLGLFPTDQPGKMDVVDVDEQARVRRIAIKPDRTDLRLAWIYAVWTSRFTSFLRAFQEQRGSGEEPEVHIGQVIGDSISAGLHVDSVEFAEEHIIDIGTPEDLVRAVRVFSQHAREP